MTKATINEFLKRYKVDREVNYLQRDMYDFFQRAFLKKDYFVCLTNNQSKELNDTIKKHLQKLIERIEEEKRYEVEMSINGVSELPVFK